MKKKTLLLLSFCAILVAAFQVGGRQATGDNAATGIAFLPSTDLNLFSDLDARDAQNRPIIEPAAVQNLVILFRENLVILTVFATPHSTASALAWINSLSYLFDCMILPRIVFILDLFQEAIMPPTRRFVHNVDNLCVTFSVGIYFGSLLLCAFALQNSPRQVPLRL